MYAEIDILDEAMQAGLPAAAARKLREEFGGRNCYVRSVRTQRIAEIGRATGRACDVARQFGVSTTTVYRARKSGLLSALKMRDWGCVNRTKVERRKWGG